MASNCKASSKGKQTETPSSPNSRQWRSSQPQSSGHGQKGWCYEGKNTVCWQLQWGFNGKSRDGTGVWDPNLSHHVLRDKDNWSSRLQQGRSGRPPAFKAPEANTSSRKASQHKLASIVLLRACPCTHRRTFSALELSICWSRLTHFPHAVGSQQIFTVRHCINLYL